MAELQQRWQAIQQRLDAAEAASGLFCRFAALAARLDALEHALQQQQVSTETPAYSHCIIFTNLPAY
jgi:hypothetical protein